MAGITANATASPQSPRTAPAAIRCANTKSAATFAAKNRRRGQDSRGGEAWRQKQQEQSRRAKRVKQNHQQPLPDVSTVRECTDQGRESREERVNHGQDQHRNPESSHGGMIATAS